MLGKIKRIINGEIPTSYLVRKGLKVGNNFSRGSGCFIDPSHCFLISIGNNVTLSINVVILSHDASTAKLIGYTKIGKVVIEDNVFIGANSIILPNITIGENSIVGSGSVVTKNFPKNTVVAGNPAKVICSVEKYKEKHIKQSNVSKCFSEEYKVNNNPTKEMLEEMIEEVTENICYIK